MGIVPQGIGVMSIYSHANRIMPPARKGSEFARVLRPIYDEKAGEFLHYLRQMGQVSYAASMTGMTRRTFYNRRNKDPEFAEAWDDAVAAFEEELTSRVVQTALEMGTGKWVQCFDSETGAPELDDDFEPVYRFETTNVDPRVLNKLLSLRMSSADGPAQTNIQMNNSTTVNGPLPSKPKLVQPQGVTRSSSVADTVKGSRYDTIDAEVVQTAPQETGGAI